MNGEGGETTQSSKRPTTNSVGSSGGGGNGGGLTSLLSCRERAESFARSLQFRLRSLGSSQQQQDLVPAVIVQSTTPSSSSISTISEASSSKENAWSAQPSQSHIEQIANSTSLPQSLLHLPTTNASAVLSQSTLITAAGDMYYDIDLNPCSPGSPAEECEYIRLIEIASGMATTAASTVVEQPQDDLLNDDEEGQRASQVSSRASSGCSLSSMDGPYYDPAETVSMDSSETVPKSSIITLDFYDCDDNNDDDNDEVKGLDAEFQNGHYYPQQLQDSSDSCSESLPNSQSTTTSLSITFNANNGSVSNNTLQDETILELCLLSKEQYHDDVECSKDAVPPPSPPLPLPISYNAECYPRIADHVIEASPEPESSCIEASPSTNGHSLTIDLSPTAMHDKDYDATHRQNDEDDFDMRPQRVRRCSSLKTGKTPPGTPGRKKYVRFADVLGLDLADVKTFMDEIPIVPRSAYEDLAVSPDDDDIYANGLVGGGGIDETDMFGGPILQKILVPLFEQPGGMAGFLDLVREQNVCLENVMVTDPICLTIAGTVRVRNLDFNKSVHVRYTLDAWRTYSDFQAMYIPNSCDGFSDKFTFTIFGNSLQVGQRIEMAVRFSCKGDQYWDSNFGANYCFQCLPTTSKATVSSAIGTANGGETHDEQMTPAAVSNAQNTYSGTFY